MKRIPVRISGAFFVTAGLIGFLNSGNLVGTLVWMGIILVSVLFHEFGHALTALMFGQRPRIELIAFGGLTIPEGAKLRPWKEFIVVFMGPFFGFLLFVAASILLQFPYGTPFAREVIAKLRVVNLFWTFINLLPILPLDGGQLVRILLEWIFGPKSLRWALYLSLGFAALFSVACFLIGLFLIGAIFFIFAFQSIEGLRKVQNFSSADQSEDNRSQLQDVERMISLGNYEAAIVKLQVLIKRVETGIIHTVASEYLAKIYYDREDYKRAYDTVVPLEKHLSKEGKVVLYISSYEVGDFRRVIGLSGICFQERQTADIALMAAASHAMLKDIKKCIEWLKTVRSFGTLNLREIITDHAFDPIRDSEIFREFLSANEKK